MKYKLMVAIGFYLYSFQMVIAAFYLYKHNHYIPMVVFSLFATMNAIFKIECDGEAPEGYSFYNAKIAYILWYFIKLLIIIVTVATVMVHWYIITALLFFLIIRIEEPIKIYLEN